MFYDIKEQDIRFDEFKAIDKPKKQRRISFSDKTNLLLNEENYRI